jgi:putative DNA primase/helicase
VWLVVVGTNLTKIVHELDTSEWLQRYPDAFINVLGNALRTEYITAAHTCARPGGRTNQGNEIMFDYVTNVFTTFDEAKISAKSPELIIVIDQPSNHLIATIIPTADMLALVQRRPNGALQTTQLTLAENVPSGPVRITLDPANDDGIANEPVVREFLEIINKQAARAIEAAGGSDRPGLLQMSRLYPGDKRGTIPSRFALGEVDRMLRVALGDAAGGHNSYIEGRTVKREVTGSKRGELEDTEWVFALVIDADNDKSKAAAVLGAPSLIVETSPGNFQFWYFLDRALPANEAQEIGKLIREASTGVDKGATGKPTQPYRSGGTVNYPDAKKMARGRYVAAVLMIEHSGKLYTADELRETFKSTPEAGKRKRDDGHSQGYGEGEDYFQSRAWAREDALPTELRATITKGVDDDEDRSKEFFKVVSQLKRKFWPLDSIVALFEKYPDGIALKYKGRVREEAKRCWDKIEPARDNLPAITIAKGQLTRMLTQTEQALLKAGVPMYERNGVLVHPKPEEFDAGKGRKTTLATLRRYTGPSMRIDIEHSAHFVTWKKNGKIFEPNPEDAPPELAHLILGNARHWKVKRISSITTVPILKQDGTLIAGDKPRYDDATGIYYMPGLELPAIPEKPTQDQVNAARDLLLDLIDEFPFVDPYSGAVSRSVALSAIMTPLVRPVIDVSPLFFFRAHTPGSGKSYLVEIMSTVATGALCPVTTFTTDEKEMEKRLGAMIMASVPIISLDNCDVDIGGNILCVALSQPRVSFRILGLSEMPGYDNRATIVATGNNVGVFGDMTRRTLMCNLNHGVERPEEEQFTKSPVDMVRANRGEYIAAILTIIRGYLAAGAPAKYGTLNGYDQWSRMVRGPLIWLGQADPVVSMAEARADDPKRAAIQQFLGYAVAQHGAGIRFRVSDVLEDAEKDLDLKNLLLFVAGERGGVITSNRVGMWLKSFHSRVVDGHMLTVETGGRTAQYRVVVVE